MNYLKIDHDDVCNGIGLRCTIWFSGCSHHCPSCQNPQTWNPDSGIPFDESAKQEIINELSKDYISGITFSGGDPLHENNLKDVVNLIFKVKENFPQKTIWLYTGYSFEELKEMYKTMQFAFSPYNEWKVRWDIIKMCDVLVDGEYIEEQKDITLKWRGSKNQRVINIPETLKQNKIVSYCD